MREIRAFRYFSLTRQAHHLGARNGGSDHLYVGIFPSVIATIFWNCGELAGRPWDVGDGFSGRGGR
jgi:hypothetical protein